MSFVNRVKDFTSPIPRSSAQLQTLYFPNELLFFFLALDFLDQLLDHCIILRVCINKVAQMECLKSCLKTTFKDLELIFKRHWPLDWAFVGPLLLVIF